MNEFEARTAVVNEQLDAVTIALRHEASRLFQGIAAAVIAGVALLAVLYTANAAWSVMGGLAVVLVWLALVGMSLALGAIPSQNCALWNHEPLPAAHEDAETHERRARDAARQNAAYRGRHYRRADRWLRVSRVGVMLTPIVFLLATSVFWSWGWDMDGTSDGTDVEVPTMVQA